MYTRAGAVILNHNLTKCLMVYQKSSSYWGIPKGSKLDNNENEFVCMLREVQEEVGLNFHYIKYELLGKIDIHNDSCIFVMRIFLNPLPICCPPLEDNKDNHEIEKIEWVPLKEAYIRHTNSITRKSFIELQKNIHLLRKNSNTFRRVNRFDRTT